MPVLSHGILLARSVSSARVTTDLMAVEGTPATYGTYNPSTAEWVEVLTLQACIERLEAWETHHSRPGARLPCSAVTELGERWLNQPKT